MSYETLNETHFKKNDKFYDHYRKHVATSWHEYFEETTDEIFEPMDEDEYDQYAHELTLKHVSCSDFDSSNNYIGFVTKDDRIVKFGKNLDELVIYKCKQPWDTNTITYYKLNHTRAKERYNRLKSLNYKRDITSEDDRYNVDENFQVISMHQAINEELLLEMANVSKRVSGLPYDMWIDSNGCLRNTQHNIPRVKIHVDDELIPVSISDDPQILVKNKTINKWSWIRKYIIAYKDILLAHYNQKIDDTAALELLKTLDKAKDATVKLSDMTQLPEDVEIQFSKIPDGFLIVVKSKNKTLETMYAEDWAETSKTIRSLKNKYKMSIIKNMDS